MAKDLPYFRFTVSEWLNDDISLEDYHLQGVFICVCSFYWFQDCSIAKAKLKKRFSDAEEEIEQLLELGILKEGDDGFIQIKFLDDQYDMLSEKRKKRVEAGRKGGLASSKLRSSNAKVTLNQSSSYKDNDKDKEKIVSPGRNERPLVELDDSDFNKNGDVGKDELIDRLTYSIFKMICKNIPETHQHIKKATISKWRDSVRLMHEQDELAFTDIHDVARFATTDEFWRTTVSSTSGIRKNLAEIQKQMLKRKDEGESEKVIGDGIW